MNPIVLSLQAMVACIFYYKKQSLPLRWMSESHRQKALINFIWQLKNADSHLKVDIGLV